MVKCHTMERSQQIGESMVGKRNEVWYIAILWYIAISIQLGGRAAKTWLQLIASGILALSDQRW